MATDEVMASPVAEGDTTVDQPEVVGEPMQEDDLDFADEVGKEVKLTDDGGCVKKILAVGEGWESPEKGDEVTVHYVGTLEDGTKFDSSRDRDQPFVFTLGEGRVIKGWDTGVATMKRGEKALLICQPDYAYGAQGSPPKIPPNATLHFEVELLSWRSVKDIVGDGGIIKSVTAEGSGWEQCQDLFEAKVSYSARVAGAEAPFASAEAVTFTVSEGLLVPAVRVAVKTMKRGERVQLKVKPEYGFGAAGSSEYGVPPGADLEIELTLLGWNNVEYCNNENTVVKKTLVECDNEYRRPNEGASVTLRVTGKVLPDGPVFMKHGEGSELRFVTEEEQVPEGLELAVMKMKKGETAVVTVNDPAYGYGDKPRTVSVEGSEVEVPAGSRLQFEVDLVDFTNAKETWEMSDIEKAHAAKQRKDKGNAFFKSGKLARAQSCWDRAVAAVSYDKSFPDEAKAIGKEVKRSCWLNLAALDLKRAHWKDAVKHCTSVLDIDPTSVKALYRRAQAHMGMADFFEAEQDVKRALELEPDSADVLALQRRLKAAQREQNKKEAKLYSKMFAAPKVAAVAAAPAAAAPAVVPDGGAEAEKGTEAEAAPAAPEVVASA
ncbi:hypothetical protein CHLRE_09g398067v5 [Chlamydomonas reinhardtii]|uniref:peptidylprolyl isomerase n=1 Tax=Chlamydomonas reinhardtii TaxID=3055 RepID=A0A2K3DES1_CHLRE|nr:uncharacterized protein CHLRE_09g398067v5 [Chlamydomonas reinhardtii]PNW79024.1 hypothetical protein CHLRE_09g398067v5 [Chlamydomonas reinhardtii]